MKKEQILKLIFLGLGIRVITAFFSEGYWHPDEYFQIFEPLHYLRGNVGDMPWEWTAQVRSLLQINIYRMFLFPFESFLNPFNQILITRIFMALLSTWAFLFWLNESLKSGSLDRVVYEKILFFWAILGFLPFLAVRTSSETAGALSFFVFLGLWEKVKFKDSFIHSTLLGFAAVICFYLRFQMAFAFLGFGIWILCFAREKLKNNGVPVILGLLLGISLCLVSDRWGYGVWVFSPWNYFKTNIIESKAAEFGVSPFWEYFRMMISMFFPLIGILSVSWLLFLKRHTFSEISFLTFAFFVAHSLVGHKEFRFVSFLYWFSPLFITQGYFWVQKVSKPFHKFFYRGLLLVSIVYLLIGFFPVRLEFSFYRRMLTQVPKNSTIEVESGAGIPLIAHGLKFNFLGFNDYKFNSMPNDNQEKFSSKSDFVFSKRKIPNCELFLVQNGMRLVPSFLEEKLLKAFNIEQKFLYKCP